MNFADHAGDAPPKLWIQSDLTEEQHIVSLPSDSKLAGCTMSQSGYCFDTFQCSCRKFHRQVAAGYDWSQGDIQWSERNSILYPAVSSLAGLVAGMFGVGGGIVKARIAVLSYH